MHIHLALEVALLKAWAITGDRPNPTGGLPTACVSGVVQCHILDAIYGA